MTRAELRYGAARRQSARLDVEIDAFLRMVFSLPWDDAAAGTYGDLRAELERVGTPIGNLDTMIAAHARANGLALVSNNVRHFSLVAGLRLENWLE